ncbi:MAG: dihydrofolate synthase [Bacteroidetes bacterium HGW-Bacteroidetes-6]|jgi:dihydrofolate synthase/folylpolyglutamate synthase|nr:MAG: dihydrofolate synthase [Bacteroidetes bacterium HGW-Bacteroidetes-6]
MDYKKTVDYIMSALPMYQRIGSAAYKANLDSTIALAAHIGNPERNFRTIHIAGTNGKGSVSHMLAAVFQSAGYKTGLYTSPHLTDYRERIRVDGKMIEKKFVSQFIQQHREFLDKIKPSFFEMTAVLAFDYFYKKNVDIAIIETGMGGRLDSTNIILPELTAITNIGLDHTQFLGNTLPAIAAEKAGIIKSKVPVVIGETNQETESIFRKTARSHQSEIIFADQFCKTDITRHSLVPPLLKLRINTPTKSINVQSSLAGIYQKANINTTITSIECLRKMGYKLPDSAIKNGIAHVTDLTHFRGRWTVWGQKPTVIFDTGHNKDGLTLISEMLASISCNKLHMVIGMVDDKNHKSLLDLLPENATYYFCKPSIPRGFDAKKLQLIAQNMGLSGKTFLSVASALKSARKNANENDIIFVGGSTFTVADAIEKVKCIASS